LGQGSLRDAGDHRLLAANRDQRGVGEARAFVDAWLLRACAKQALMQND
jgi:hypothetical protein